MNTHLLFPRVLCSEGSRVWLRRLGAAVIYQSAGLWRVWGKSCTLLLSCAGLSISVTYHPLPLSRAVDGNRSPHLSPGYGMERFTEMEDSGRACWEKLLCSTGAWDSLITDACIRPGPINTWIFKCMYQNFVLEFLGVAQNPAAATATLAKLPEALQSSSTNCLHIKNSI